MKANVLDLIDFEKVDALLEGFNKSTGFVTAILDLEGNVLSKSGWRQICTEFHRVNPETSRKCTVSDTELAGRLAEGEKYHFYKCLNGLVDVAVPIVIREEHIANLFSGQFFFEEPDHLFFKKQAEKYRFDESIYLKALRDVPVISEEKVKTAMEFLLKMTHLISEMTFQKLEQMELNEELRKSEERWQFAIEGNGDGLWDWNVQTNELYLSKQWKAMLGYEDIEIKNNLDEWEKRVHPEDLKRVYEAIQNYLNKTTKVFSVEHRLQCKNGSYKWINSRGKIISWTDDEKPLRFIGTHNDITDHKKVEREIKSLNQTLEHRVSERTAQLQSANKELESFSYSISHDLRAPLRAIFGFSQIISQRHKDSLNVEGKQYVDYVVDASIRMEQLINDLLSYSRLGRAGVTLVPVALNKIVDDVHSDFKAELLEINGTFEIDNELPTILGDDSLLHQIFSNLIGNAIKYRRTDVPFKINIQSEPIAEGYRVKVIDNGIGISDQHYDKIFNVFQRLHGESKYSGTGIGLANVKKAVTLLRGTIQVESIVNSGSTFIINFMAI